MTSSRRLLGAADAHPESAAILEKYGFTVEERARGRMLITNAERAFEWERAGTAWNFLSRTPSARRREAVSWFVDTRWRRFRAGFVAAERAVASALPLFGKTTGAARALASGFSPVGLVEDQVTLVRNLVRAGGERPPGAPPPKDSTLVQLQGWYERWRLLVQRVFRGRPDLMAPYGLKPGKAPPRLRGQAARLKYGEGAAGFIGTLTTEDCDDDGDDAATQTAGR